MSSPRLALFDDIARPRSPARGDGRRGAERNALTFVEGLDRSEFMDDAVVQHAVAMCLVRLGEAARRLLKNLPEFGVEHAHVPWEKLVGMRNRIAHGYTGVDMAVVWTTVSEDMRGLLSSLEPLLALFPFPDDRNG